MVLVGDGRLDLDAPVRRWIARRGDTGTVAPAARPLRRAAPRTSSSSAGCATRAPGDPRRAPGRPSPRASAATPPGAVAVYSDLGFIQLGAVLERAGGRAARGGVRASSSLGRSASPRATRRPPIGGAVATELDERGLVQGVVHDENAYFGGGVLGHAGLFATHRRCRRGSRRRSSTPPRSAARAVRADVVRRFFTERAAPGASWRLGWDTPSHTPGVSQAGDRWPRARRRRAHSASPGTSLWLDLAHRRWVVAADQPRAPDARGRDAPTGSRRCAARSTTRRSPCSTARDVPMWHAPTTCARPFGSVATWLAGC